MRDFFVSKEKKHQGKAHGGRSIKLLVLVELQEEKVRGRKESKSNHQLTKLYCKNCQLRIHPHSISLQLQSMTVFKTYLTFQILQAEGYFYVHLLLRKTMNLSNQLVQVTALPIMKMK